MSAGERAYFAYCELLDKIEQDEEKQRKWATEVDAKIDQLTKDENATDK